MVFHVTGAGIRELLALELVKQFLRILAQGVYQHVQTATVCHAQHDFLGTVGAGTLDQFVQARNQAFAAFQAKTLDARITGAQIFFQAFGSGETLEHVLAGFRFVLRAGAYWLHPLLEPTLDAGIHHVHIFGANAFAIGLAQALHDVSELHGLGAEIQ